MVRTIFICIILLSLLSACLKDKSAANNCQTCTAISFKNDIIPVFTANCALAGCHLTSTGTNAHVALDSADAYLSIMHPGTGYVVAGNPGYSILLGQLYAGVPHHMPNNGGQLDNCSIEKISCWIQQGALNN